MAFKSNDKSERITVRMTASQIEYLEKLACQYNCTVSDVLRMFVNMQMYSTYVTKES